MKNRKNFDIADKVCYRGRETEIISILSDNFYLLAGIGHWVSGDKIKLVSISEPHEPNINFKYNDGGREAAGFKGKAGGGIVFVVQLQLLPAEITERYMISLQVPY